LADASSRLCVVTVEDVANVPERQRRRHAVELVLADLEAQGCVILTTGALRLLAPLLGEVHERVPLREPVQVRGRSLFVIHPQQPKEKAA